MIYLKTDIFIPDRIHGQKISKNKVKQIVQKVITTNCDKRKNIKGIPEDRTNIIILGLILLESLVDFFSCNFLIISDFGLIEGIMKNFDYFCYN